jgi:hypothetical protein
VEDVTGVTIHSDFGPFFCTDCHMVPTAKSGAAVPELLDRGGSGELDVQYYWNDTASHRLSMTRWTEFTGQPDQPIAFTNACGTCHASSLPNPPAP